MAFAKRNKQKHESSPIIYIFIRLELLQDYKFQKQEVVHGLLSSLDTQGRIINLRSYQAPRNLSVWRVVVAGREQESP